MHGSSVISRIEEFLSPPSIVIDAYHVIINGLSIRFFAYGVLWNSTILNMTFSIPSLRLVFMDFELPC